MSKFLPCKNICPVVQELREKIAFLAEENSKLVERIDFLASSKRDDEIRIQRAKQALFGLPDSNVRGGP